MKNEKLENAKSKIVEFYDKHETAIKIGVGVTTLVGFVGWAVYCGKKHPVISGVSGVVDAQGPDDKCVTFGRDALTQDGLEILKAVIDNPVIVDR